MVRWSDSQLESREQQLLRRLSIFRDGWSLELAERVCGFDGIDELEVLDLLCGLVDRSLVTVRYDSDGERYGLLEIVRAFAHEQLAVEEAEVTVVRQLHAEAIMALARTSREQFEGQGAGGARTRQATLALAVEQANAVAALEWLLAEPERHPSAHTLAIDLGWFWAMHSVEHPGAAPLRAALSLRSPGIPSPQRR